MGKAAYKEFNPEKYYSCVMKSKQWKKKIKGNDQSGKMPGFQNAAEDRIKSTANI